MKKPVICKEDILTLDKMGEELGLSKETLEKWREKGMPAIKIDKFTRVYRPHVLHWIITQGEIFNCEDQERKK